MKVLGIDPGYGRCGLAVIERAGDNDALLYSGCVETAATEDFSARLKSVVDECARLARVYEPHEVALEKLFFSKNRKTAMRVSEVRGALLSLAASLALPVHEYGPGEVKSAIAGSARADKIQVAKMLRLLVDIRTSVEHDDEFDAIAIALTHLSHVRTRAARSRARSRLQ